MKEIKFRGKRLDNNKWYYGSYLYAELSKMDWRGDTKGNPEPVHYIIDKHDVNIAVNPETVSQYTGLHDKNGNEIYEGDILESANKRYKERYVVGYDVMWGFTFKQLIDLNSETSEYDLAQNMLFNKVEVAGNIYENPDLIK